MGCNPYVPRDVIDKGRYRPSGRVPVFDYPEPYPFRANKVVTVVHFGAADRSGSADKKANTPSLSDRGMTRH